MTMLNFINLSHLIIYKYSKNPLLLSSSTMSQPKQLGELHTIPIFYISKQIFYKENSIKSALIRSFISFVNLT